eukprot:TRINITY_DN1265_c0_g2_i1.p1 TRINITY_DN1265_c0_g2~~TRINITY_DN1265_c0_g2_i1.p1  ORF type:complete len:597 (-),score=178.98 TRINITY_DN1265_c0_g2_i1:118-1908(-)
MNLEGSVELTDVVLDSGAVISGSSIQSLGPNVRFVTVPNVLAEIRDKRSRELLEAFPFQLHLQTPSAAAMKTVCEFSKLCGEFHELSVTDLEVMALTYQLEVEKNGFENIRSTPFGLKLAPEQAESPVPAAAVSEAPVVKPKISNSVWGGKSSVSFAEMVKKSQQQNEQQQQQLKCQQPTVVIHEEIDEAYSSEEEEEAPEDSDNDADSFVQGELVEEQEVEEFVAAAVSSSSKAVEELCDDDDYESFEEGEEVHEQRVEDFLDELLKLKLEKKEREDDVESFHEGQEIEYDSHSDDAESFHEGRESEALQRHEEIQRESVEVNEVAIEGEMKEAEHREEQDELRQNFSGKRRRHRKQRRNNEQFEGVWITLDNVDMQQEGSWGVSADNNESQQQQQQKKKRKNKNKLPRFMKSGVACMTVDFGMQNVMAQMGLRLLAVDGRSLQRVRHWALGCFGCREICNDLSREFCPACGGHTLIRVGVNSNPRTGEIRYYWNKRRLTTARRGVKYSIPKPKAGRHASNIILREDELLAARSRGGRPKAVTHSVDNWTDKGMDFGFVTGAGSFLPARKNSDVRYGPRRRNPNEVAKKTGNKKR